MQYSNIYELATVGLLHADSDHFPQLDTIK